MIVSRLIPGCDLKKGIKDITQESNIKSGVILCIVGSLESATLRMSNGDTRSFNGPFEIVSAEGTISEDGIHVHISISDDRGDVFGGHMLHGCVVHTTAEICIMKTNKVLRRVFDPKTGYRELLVEDLDE